MKKWREVKSLSSEKSKLGIRLRMSLFKKSKIILTDPTERHELISDYSKLSKCGDQIHHLIPCLDPEIDESMIMPEQYEVKVRENDEVII
jgi:hypothetical protein